MEENKLKDFAGSFSLGRGRIGGHEFRGKDFEVSLVMRTRGWSRRHSSACIIKNR